MKLPQTTGFVNQAGGEVSLSADDPENQALAAACVIRHAKSEADAQKLREMLGLDEVPVQQREPGPQIAPHLAARSPRPTRGKS